MNSFEQKFSKDLQLFYQATGIPFCVFDNAQNVLLRYPVISSMECSLQTMQKCSELLKAGTKGPHFPIFISSASCFVALIQIDSDINIMFGPVSSIPLTYKAFFDMNQKLSTPDDLMHLYRVVQQSPHLKPEQFVNNMSLYIRFVFNDEIAATEILANGIKLPKSNADSEIVTMQKTEFIMGAEANELENRILFHIQNGHTSELLKIMNNISFFTIRESFPSTLEELRKEFFVFASHCLKAVIEEGLAIQKAYAVFDMYISHISSIITVQHFGSMCKQIAIDYCQQMAELYHNQMGSQVVIRCMQYIENHLYTRLTIDDLAKQCHFSKRTITRHFTKYNQIPVAEYILQLKLKEAAFLLSNSTFSLVEISNQLAFSSQSHFSAAFKKRYNYTPRQYRNKYKTI